MDVREKIVELLQDANNPVWKWFPNNMAMLQLADYLIENGVTVQEWIPVTERLPEDGQSVLTYKNGIYDIQTYEERRNGWVSGNWFWSMATVTRWMPLPQPPKEE